MPLLLLPLLALPSNIEEGPHKIETVSKLISSRVDGYEPLKEEIHSERAAYVARPLEGALMGFSMLFVHCFSMRVSLW